MILKANESIMIFAGKCLVKKLIFNLQIRSKVSILFGGFKGKRSFLEIFNSFKR